MSGKRRVFYREKNLVFYVSYRRIKVGAIFECFSCVSIDIIRMAYNKKYVKQNISWFRSGPGNGTIIIGENVNWRFDNYQRVYLSRLA